MSTPQDPTSPFNYPPSQTALLLLDFQTFTINLCASAGEAALAKAATLRQWALSQKILIIHSIIDIDGTVPPQTKGVSRVQNMLAGIKSDPESGREPPSIAAGTDQSKEVVSLKQPGIVSGIKSEECQGLLKDRGIKNLIICGLSTSGAVLRTTVPATDDGYVVSVISDACADRTVELHETLMASVLGSRAHVATLEEFLGEWKKGESGR
ncbi:hypothetical protein M409DRAFT_29794 [Zasmidium cellare ATCC 36951]|uniref:Isochorismatase-like domain-containing protein n=1 Tax=Zasmidium cellare ATCC 36951 TaxID=1080233 RepID=A0A6A6BYK8_ZASCE|nr:uncharacterized protein M409DRAFT_29794 [Zasmidium cellare ATCC 36951]KAF2159795.1 hypothetical protein M409DRAFT_29794 [Zasmidium cellare ATCC 36951]